MHCGENRNGWGLGPSSFLVKYEPDDIEKKGKKGEPSYKVNSQTGPHEERLMNIEDLETDVHKAIDCVPHAPAIVVIDVQEFAWPPSRTVAL